MLHSIEYTLDSILIIEHFKDYHHQLNLINLNGSNNIKYKIPIKLVPLTNNKFTNSGHGLALPFFKF